MFMAHVMPNGIGSGMDQETRLGTGEVRVFPGKSHRIGRPSQRWPRHTKAKGKAGLLLLVHLPIYPVVVSGVLQLLLTVPSAFPCDLKVCVSPGILQVPRLGL